MDIKNRLSPTQSATLFKVDTIKTGNDGNKWIIVENKNGVKRWKLYKKSSKKPSKKSSKKPSKKISKKPSKKISKKPSKKISKKPSKKGIDLSTFYGIKIVSQKQLEKISQSNPDSKYIYDIIKSKIIPQINKLGIETFLVPLPLSDNNKYWDDFPPDYIKSIFKKDILDIDFMFFVFDLNKNANEINLDKSIRVQFSRLDLDKKINIINIFEKYLFGYFEWNGSNHKSIIINFIKTKNPKHIDKKNIKQNDTYPILTVNLDSKINLIQDKITLNKLVDGFENLNKKYFPIWSAGIFDFECLIYSFDMNDKKYIENIKKFVKSLKFIIKCEFGLIKDEYSEKIIFNK
jgi:hypothetical protein